MTLKEFVKLVKDVSPYVKGNADNGSVKTATSMHTEGITCQVYLDGDGNISAEATSICLQFTIPGKAKL